MSSVANTLDGSGPDTAVVAEHEHLQQDAWRTLADYHPGDAGQAALAEAFRGLLSARPDATARACAPGHITASALVLSADRSQILLTLHPRVGRWLQLGGHLEPGDRSVAEAALREALEESGIPDLTADGVPVHLDVHPITCSLGIPTRHFDIRYTFRAPYGAEPVCSSESKDLRFWPIADLPRGPEGVDASLLAALAAAGLLPA